MTTGNWSTGSIADFIGALVGWANIPTGISGTVLNNIIEQEINFVEQYAQITISSSAIPEKYQPPIIQLAQSDLLLAIDTNNGGVSDISLGDLSVSQGSAGNSSVANQLRESALKRLKELQRTVRFKRVIGA